MRGNGQDACAARSLSRQTALATDDWFGDGGATQRRHAGATAIVQAEARSVELGAGETAACS